MALTGLSFAEEDVFISEADPSYVKNDPIKSEQEGATVFVWKNVPSGIMARIQDMSQVIETEQFSIKQTYKTQHSQKHREAVKYACKSIRNFKDKNGQPITAALETIFEFGQMITVLTDVVLDAIPLSILNEFGQHIIKSQAMTEDQAKNSEALLLRLGGLGTTDATSAPSVNGNSADTTSTTSDTDLTASEQS